MRSSRKGVSIIAVLLFMLVATIAGTATYKWLSSEGFTSASRLLINQARASALAGVDAARSWMSTHGNETGAIVRQFLDNGGKPISLNNVLASMGKDNQQFDVYLVGVEYKTANPNYKLKILSKGTVVGRDVSYTESAFLNVIGLYQVRIPVQKKVLDYNYAYFGGSTSYAGEHHVSAMLINGNWGVGQNMNGANPGFVEDDFIVTGNARLSGNKMSIGGTTCIGKDLAADNGFWGNDLYVGGDAKHGLGNNNDFVGQIAGNAYFNHDVTIGNQANPGFDVTGNVTLNGTMQTNLGAFGHFIHGNLCLGNDAKVNLGDGGNSWRVDNNVWVPKSKKDAQQLGIITTGNSNEHKRVFGGKKSTKLYIKNGEACTTNCPDSLKPTKQKHDGGSNATFRTNGDVYLTIPDSIPFKCAESVKKYCDDIWHTAKPDEEKCGGATLKVNDLLKTGHNQFETFANKAANSTIAECKNLTKISSGNTTKMNTCWKKLMDNSSLRSTYLYNDYLVLKMSFDENEASNADGTSAPRLDGKFLFIFENAITANHIHFPRTTSSARVFVYMERGAPSSNSKINCATSDTYNYFIFTKANVGGMLGSCTWSGSIYATATNCAAIPDINGSVTLEYNAALVNDMVNSGIICANDNNPQNPCPVGAPSPDSTAVDSASAVNPALFDGEHIATGTHLNVTIESEYKSDESVDEFDDVIPSVVALPRAVYINKDAPGSMKDYLSVIPLNGFPEIKGDPTLTCPNQSGAPKMTGKISSGNALEGIYHCVAKVTEGGKSDTSHFYVVVAGEAASTPMVHFSGQPSHEFDPGQYNEAVLSVVVTPTEVAMPISVSVSMTDEPNGWTVTRADGSPVQWRIGGDGARYIQLPLQSTSEGEVSIPVFRVRTANNALSGTLRFTLHSPQGCIIGGGTVVKSYNILGKITVHRADLKTFCARYPIVCSEKPQYNMAKNVQDCDSSTVWIRAYGVGCNPDVGYENRRWTCDANVGPMNEIQLVAAEYDRSLCEVYIPTAAEHNVIVDPKSDNMNPNGDTLYASLKRKFYRLNIKTRNASSGMHVRVDTSSTFGSNYKKLGECSSSDGCSYIIYAGQTVRVTPEPRDDFSHWEGEEPYFTSHQNNVVALEFMMDQNRNYTAVFDEKDPHCFYSDFKQYASDAIWCPPDKIECIDYCPHSTTCDIENGAHPNASWVEINSNGTTAKPEVSGGYLKNSSTDVAFIMNAAKGGASGEFAARIRTGVISQNSFSNTSFINSAIVVRSKNDGSEYISVNFFGTSPTGAEGSQAAETHVRVCYANALVKTAGDHCKEVNFSNGLLPSPGFADFRWTSGIQLNSSVIVVGDSLYVKLSYVAGQSLKQIKGSVDLRQVVNNDDYTLNDEDHNYVGIKLGDNAFGVYDASWTSYLYQEECFDPPSVYCSFADKYLGGEVPINENVSPAIGYSKWFLDQGSLCSTRMKFYYNGCDLASSSYANNFGMSMLSNWSYCKNDVCGEGMISNAFAPSGLELKRDADFNFSCEGKHGFEHLNPQGYARNASVEVDCRLVNGTVYTANCGEFYVGRKHSCRQDEHFVTSSENHGIEDVFINIPRDDGANLREANIMFGLSLGAGVNVRAWLVDVNGSLSDPVSLNESGPQLIPYERFSDRYGFNPEKVKKIKLKGSGSYTIDSIASYCTHTLKVYCGQNDAVYTGNHWKITANIDPLEEAKVCKVVANEDGVTESYFGLCNTGVFNLEDPGFIDRMNEESGTTSYSFTVSVYDDINATEYSDPVSTCIATSQGYSPVEASCRLEGTNAEFPQGTGVPAVIVNADNCPDMGCEYDLRLVGSLDYTHSDRISGEKRWLPSVNEATALTQGTYYYEFKLMSSDRSKQYQICTTPAFSVIGAQQASASNCRVEEGHFKAYVEGSNYESVSAVLVQTDAQGVPLGTQNVAVGASSTVDFDLSSLPNGHYTLVLSLNGTQACPAVIYDVGPQPNPITLTCPGPITGQDPNDVIVVSPTVTGCDGQCDWKIQKGTTVYESGSNYTSGNVSFYDQGGTGRKDYKLNISRDVNGVKQTKECPFNVTFVSSSSSSSPASSSSSSGGGFDCNSGNSYNLGTEVLRDLKAGECIKYTMGSASTLYVGSWYAPSRPVDITIKKCDGTLTTISHDKNDWIGVTVGSSCTIYLKPEKDIQLKLNNW